MAPTHPTRNPTEALAAGAAFAVICTVGLAVVCFVVYFAAFPALEFAGDAAGWPWLSGDTARLFTLVGSIGTAAAAGTFVAEILFAPAFGSDPDSVDDVEPLTWRVAYLVPFVVAAVGFVVGVGVVLGSLALGIWLAVVVLLFGALSA